MTYDHETLRAESKRFLRIIIRKKIDEFFLDFFSKGSELYKEYDLVQQVHAAIFESTRYYDVISIIIEIILSH